MKEKKIKPPVLGEITQQPSKMRIKLFNGGSLISDRLVEQSTEFNLGPKEKHNGPISLEFNLGNQAEVDASIAYLQKLKGDLPIIVDPKKSSPRKIDKMLSEKEPLLDLFKTIKGKATSQEKLIDMLREYDFRFLNTQTIQDLVAGKEAPAIKLRDKDLDFNWMARLLKEARDPQLDKYDFRLTFGIKLFEKIGLVRVYLWGEYSETLKIKWEKSKTVNFKKVDQVFSFPEWMDIDDRKKWRVEHRKWRIATNNGENPDKWGGFSKAYNKALPYVRGLENSGIKSGK